jgi:hypothetical protein
LWFDVLHHIKIIGVYIDRFDLPIYFKHYDGAAAADIEIIIKNNMISRATRYLALAANYVQIENNVFYNCTLYPSERGGGVDGGNYGQYTHNTFYNSDISLAGETGFNLQNRLRFNVFAGSSTLGDAPYTTLDNQTDSDLNIFALLNTVYYRNRLRYSLNDYRSNYPGKELNSLAGNIVFVTGNPSF